VFLLSRVVPANPASLYAGPRAGQEAIEEARIELGLNQPLYRQYFDYMSNLIRGDLGESLRTHRPVLQDILYYLPASLEIIILGLTIGIAVGIPLGLYSAANRNSIIDHLARIVSVTGVSLPSFWLAMILQLIFFQILGIFPLGGRLSTEVSLIHSVDRITGFILIDSALQGNWIAFRDGLLHLVLPALTMAAYPIGLVTRLVRSSTVDVLGEDYIRMEKAYGIKERTILFVYALRNSFSSTLSVIALLFAYSLVSIFLIEQIFTWPGLGTYAANAIMNVDYPAIMGITLFIASLYVFMNLIVDVAQAYLDPRVRLE